MPRAHPGMRRGSEALLARRAHFSARRVRVRLPALGRLRRHRSAIAAGLPRLYPAGDAGEAGGGGARPRADRTRHVQGLKVQVTLSFDNGPEPAVTPRVLDVLDAADVKATFFVLGSKMADKN